MGQNPFNLLGGNIQGGLGNSQNSINHEQMAQYIAYQQKSFFQSLGMSSGIIYPGAKIHIPEKGELWWKRIGAVSYDPMSDSAIMATGERVRHSAAEDGYYPCKSNVEWLDRQVDSVRVKL